MDWISPSIPIIPVKPPFQFTIDVEPCKQRVSVNWHMNLSLS